ncbi:MAG: DUF4124 domain-containing protein [Gammaproteobacteria bacterium]
MRNKLLLLATTAALLFSSVVSADLYKWVDSDGNVHYGDRIPAEFANEEHRVLNEQGVQVEVVAGKLTPEEQAEVERLAAIEEQQRAEVNASMTRDSRLLNTYLSIEEIEALRDRRAELLLAQIRITELYFDNLRTKLTKLEKESQRVSPRNTAKDARPIDEKLARELGDTLDSIMLYEENLLKSKSEQNQLMAKFNNDIERFKELKTLN